MSEQSIHFPELAARNLEGRDFDLPKDLEGELNVVLVAFERRHQDLIDSWIPFLENLRLEHPNLRFYELPTLSRLYSFVRPVIDGGMAAGIPSQAARERTLTVYTNRHKVIEALEIPDTSTIGVLLVDRHGRVYWQHRGAFDEKAGGDLEQAIDQLRGVN